MQILSIFHEQPGLRLLRNIETSGIQRLHIYQTIPIIVLAPTVLSLQRQFFTYELKAVLSLPQKNLSPIYVNRA